MIHWTAVGAVALVGGLLVTSRALSTLFRRVGGPRAVGLALNALSLAALVWAYTLTVLAEPGQLVGPPLAVVVVNGLVASTVAVAGTVVVIRGFTPALDEFRPGTYTVPDWFHRRRRRTLFATATALALVVEAFRLDVVGASDAWVLVAMVVAWVVNLRLTCPLWLTPMSGVRIRDPTDDERERIEHCCERFGRTPDRIVIAADDAAIDANATGRDGYHTVGVTEPFLSRVDDTTLAVTLAQADGRSAAGYWTTYLLSMGVIRLFFLVLLVAWPAFLLEIFSTSAPLLWFVMPLLVFVFLPPLSWLARRRAYEADAFVASQFDASTIATVYRQLGADLRYHYVPSRLLTGLVGLDPTIESRLERLGSESVETGEHADGDA